MNICFWNMSKLRTRTDAGILWWRIEDSKEYDKLSDLLCDYNKVFSKDSTIIVKIGRSNRSLAKISYPITYDVFENEFRLEGLLGVFQGTGYDVFTRFRNVHHGFAHEYQAQALFYQNYEVDDDDDDDDDDESDGSDI